ncbi:hypothetical protein KCU89_g112, partial [Aureobasidium melanogenum]
MASRIARPWSRSTPVRRRLFRGASKAKGSLTLVMWSRSTLSITRSQCRMDETERHLVSRKSYNDIYKGSLESVFGRSIQPEHCSILFLISSDELNAKLRLADATKAVDDEQFATGRVGLLREKVFLQSLHITDSLHKMIDGSVGGQHPWRPSFSTSCALKAPKSSFAYAAAVAAAYGCHLLFLCESE